jgi:hypothetical protein
MPSPPNRTSVTAKGVPPSFTISIDRSKGDKLGIAYESKTLEITAVKPGLIAAWNEAHPHSLVKATDLILEVNGKSLDKHGPASLQEELNKQQELCIKLSRTITVSVRVDTRYGKLGLRFEPTTLQIKGFDTTGLMAAWSLENPDYSVLLGDRIKAVNGVTAAGCTAEGVGRMYQELLKRGLTNLVFARPANAVEAASLPAMHKMVVLKQRHRLGLPRSLCI